GVSSSSTFSPRIPSSATSRRRSRPKKFSIIASRPPRRPPSTLDSAARSSPACDTDSGDNRPVGWKIEKQANGKFAIYSTRLDDYIVIDADPLQIAQIYAEKGVRVYLASARMQLSRETQ